MWLSIGIDYQYQSIDKLVSIGIDKKINQKIHSTNRLHVLAKGVPRAGTVGGRVVRDGSQL